MAERSLGRIMPTTMARTQDHASNSGANCQQFWRMIMGDRLESMAELSTVLASYILCFVQIGGTREAGADEGGAVHTAVEGVRLSDDPAVGMRCSTLLCQGGSIPANVSNRRFSATG